jgi:hypothetical protein
VIDPCHATVDWQKEYAAAFTTGSRPAYTHSTCAVLPVTTMGSTGKPIPAEQPSPLGDSGRASGTGATHRIGPKVHPSGATGFGSSRNKARLRARARKSYIVNGDMPGGFAPWRILPSTDPAASRTFVVNQDGTVHQKDLGKDTSTGRQDDGVQPGRLVGTRGDALAKPGRRAAN